MTGAQSSDAMPVSPCVLAVAPDVDEAAVRVEQHDERRSVAHVRLALPELRLAQIGARDDLERGVRRAVEVALALHLAQRFPALGADEGAVR
jgi:hypothetical protein